MKGIILTQINELIQLMLLYTYIGNI